MKSATRGDEEEEENLKRRSDGDEKDGGSERRCKYRRVHACIHAHLSVRTFACARAGSRVRFEASVRI